jgi:hypothetical protein
VSHAEQAARLLTVLAESDEGFDPAVTAMRAQAHATLALVDAVESWRPPEDEITPDIDPINTREGFKW